jgi:hypothetical protein
MAQQVGSFVLELLAYAGGSTALAFLVFKTLGEKWLDNKFRERLKLVEHGYAIELSKLKQRLDTAASGLNRIHQKEFEVLPEAWGLLDEAMNTLKWVVSPMQSYTDVSRMSDDDWRDFVEGVEAFGKTDKRYLLGLSSRNRQEEYNRLYDAHKNWLAEKAIREFQKYAARHSIFLPEDLRNQFDAIRNLLWSASTAKSVGRQADDWKLQREGWEKLEKQADPLFQEIRKAIQSRIAKQMELDLDGLNMVRID